MNAMITLTEAAEMLGVKPGTLRKWVQKQDIACYRYPRPTSRPHFRRADIDVYLKNRRVEARRAVI